jgi:hypothetical protein
MSSPRRRQWRTVELGWQCACERSGRGHVYIAAEGRLRACYATPMTGARAAWAARLGDVRLPRRSMARGGRCAGECSLTTWHHPRGRGRHAQEHTGAAQGSLDTRAPRRVHPARVRRIRRRSDVARARRHTGARSGVRVQKRFAE